MILKMFHVVSLVMLTRCIPSYVHPVYYFATGKFNALDTGEKCFIVYLQVKFSYGSGCSLRIKYMKQW